MCTCSRRSFLGMALVAQMALSACTRQTEGPEEIRYGREACTMCGMIISDPRFAAEIRGGPDRALVKFDDMGDAVNWLEMQAWRNESLLEFWVMDSDNGKDWLDARNSHYLTGQISPMDYGYAAVKDARTGTVSYEVMRKAALERGITSRCPPGTEQPAQ